MNKSLGRFATAGALVAVLALAGCAQTPNPTPTGAPTTPPTTVTPGPTTTPTPTAAPQDIALPTNCDALFSVAWKTQFAEWQLPPNDPEITMDSTRLTAGLNLLGGSIPALRCTWGMPGDVGVVTTIMLVTPGQAASVRAEAMATEGFVCAPVSAVEERCDYFESGSDELGEYMLGEESVFRGNAWISTAYLNVPIDFLTPTYTDTVVASLWR